MTKSSATGSAIWIARDAKSGRFVNAFTVPGMGEIRVMPSQTLIKANRTAAGRLRSAIANATGRKPK